MTADNRAFYKVRKGTSMRIDLLSPRMVALLRRDGAIVTFYESA